MITLNDAITASNKYPDRLTNTECTDKVKDNLTELLKKVNDLLTELAITHVTISSGFRPSEVNGATKGSAKHSLHMSGDAIDIQGHIVYDAVEKSPDLLKKYGLWMEDKHDATTWTHLDQGTRSDRPIRIFRA